MQNDNLKFKIFKMSFKFSVRGGSALGGQASRLGLHASRFKLHALSFSLIEMMVSVSIMSILIISAVGIYIYVIGPQQKIIAAANLQQDGQLVMSVLAKDIRQDLINYDYYAGGITNPVNVLALKNSESTDGYPYVIYKKGLANGSDCSSSVCYVLKCKLSSYNQACNSSSCPDCAGNFFPVSSSDVFVRLLNFYITPTSNPFGYGSIIYNIPRATIILELKGLREKTGERLLRMEETISNRYNEKI